uniref:Sensory/regulatory protein RpfC n=1 Tax=Magnetococcus massalia (strain MO-1) TaxID=451514 RepID=A0A1S7LKK0_MAGMO|nr:putative response regulator receiver modulated hybrid Histidine kinase with PAS sensor domain [Candidatus Magnetococcus massalia]
MSPLEIPKPAILMVDDKLDNLALLQELFTRLQAELVSVTHGDEALRYAIERDFALILLDVDMPGMDGFEVARTLKQIKATRNIPIIFLTAVFRDQEHRLTGYRCGAADYIEKPLEPEILLTKVQVFLDLYRVRKEVESGVEELRLESARSRALESKLQVIQYAVDHTGDAAFLIDHSGRFHYVNRSACQALGFSEEELLRMRVWEVDTTLSQERWPGYWQQLQMAKSMTFKSVHQHRSGEQFPVEIQSNQVELDGEVYRFAYARNIGNRVAVEEQLQLLSTAVEQSSATVMITNREGKIEYVNRRFESLTGYSWEEVQGQNPRMLKSNLNDPAVYADLWQTIERGDVWNGELINKRKDGSLYWEFLQISPVRRVGQEAVTHFVAVKEDVSDRKAVEQSLKIYERIVSNTSELLSFIDANYCYQAVNRACLQAFCKSELDALGHHVQDVVGEAFFHAFAKPKLDKALAGETGNYAQWVTLPDGQEHYLQIHMNPFGTPGKDDHGVVVNIVDLTERQRAQEEIKRSRARFRTVLDALDAYVYVADMESYEVLFLNRKGREIVGDIGDKLCWQNFYPEQNGPCRFCTNSRLVKEDRAVGSLVWEQFNPGMNRWLQMQDRAIPWDDGRLVRMSIAYDISELKQVQGALEQALGRAEQATRAKSEFLATMSHEIRTPMNAILGTAELLGESDLSAEQAHYVEMFTSAGEALLGVIDDVLDISKIEAGKVDLELLPFSPHKSVRDANAVVAHRAARKGLYLIQYMDASVPQWIKGDPARTRQVLLNYLSNAVKFTEHGSITTLGHCRPLKPGWLELVLTVVDTGIGISPSQQAALFEPFTQADSSISRKYGGSGLGLAISQRLAALMGGKTAFNSVLERGSSFSLSMPVELVDLPEEAERKHSLQGRQVLLVCRSPERGAEYQALLEQMGAGVVVCSQQRHVEGCLEVFKAHGVPDLVLFLHDEGTIESLAKKLSRLRDGSGQESLPIVVCGDIAERVTSRMVEALGIPFTLLPDTLDDLAKHLLYQFPLSSKPSRATWESISPAPLQILLAEDGEDNAVLVQAFLKKSPHQITWVKNGQQAVEAVMAEEAAFDLVLMDVQMPEMDGYEATRQIRAWEQREGRAAMPILALTAHALSDHVAMSLEAGCDAHLSKPVKKKTLLEALHQFALPKGDGLL